MEDKIKEKENPPEVLQTKIKNYIEKNENKTKTVDKWAKDIVDIVEKDTPNIMIYQRQIEKQNTNLKDEIKQWQVSWDILTKENTELKERFKADECDLCNDLQDENMELKQQVDRLHKNEIIYHKRLKDIKYLNRDEVGKIIRDLLEENHNLDSGICDNITGNPMKDYAICYHKNIDNKVTAICNLAYKTLDWSIVKQDYENLMMDNNIHPYSDQQMKITEFIKGLCADEILNNNDKDNI